MPTPLDLARLADMSALRKLRTPLSAADDAAEQIVEQEDRPADSREGHPAPSAVVVPTTEKIQQATASWRGGLKSLQPNKASVQEKIAPAAPATEEGEDQRIGSAHGSRSPHSAHSARNTHSAQAPAGRPQHRSPTEKDVIAIAQNYAKLVPRLLALNSTISKRLRRLSAIERPNAEKALFFELNLSTAELDFISSELGSALLQARNRLQAEQQLRTYRYVTLAALVNAGTHLGASLEFWPVFWRQLNYTDSYGLESYIRENLESWLKAGGLDTFERAQLGSAKYVSLVTLHAGIVRRDLKVIVDNAIELLAVDDDPEDGDREGNILAKQFCEPAAPRTLRLLSIHRSRLAANLFARIVEFVYYTQITPGWYQRAEVTELAGVPTKTFEELRKYLHQLDGGLAASAGASPGSDNQPQGASVPGSGGQRYADPTIMLDLDEDQVNLVLPRAPRPKGVDLVWDVDFGFDSFRHTAAIDFGTGHTKERHITIDRPTASVHVRNMLQGDHFRLQLHPHHTTTVFFNSRRELISEQHMLTGKKFFVLAPKGTTFEDDATDAPLSCGHPLPFTGWGGWEVYLLENLDHVRSLRVLSGNGSGVSVHHIKTAGFLKPEWKEPDAIKGLVGVDDRPVFGASPLLRLPSGVEAAWTAEIYRTNEVGERELILELVDLEDYGNEPFEIFSSEYEDPWVGTFDVDLLRDGLVDSHRSFHMAEDLQLSFSYEGGAFRYPTELVDSHELTKVYVEQQAGSGKAVRVSFSGTKKLSSTTVREKVQVRGAEDYLLDAYLKPSSLEYQLEQWNIKQTWESIATTVSPSALKERGFLRVRFPQKIYGDVEAVLISTKAKRTIVFSQTLKADGKRRVFSLSTAQLRRLARDKNCDLHLALRWYNESAKELRKRQTKQEVRTETWQEFKAKYDAWAHPAVRFTTLARISSVVFRGETTLRDSQVQLHRIDGQPIGGEHLVGFLWPVTRPSSPALQISFDKNGAGALPEALLGAGPLLLELKARAVGFEAAAPKQPSHDARWLAQEGYYLAQPVPDATSSPDAFGLSARMSGALGTQIFRTEELEQLWKELYSFRYFPFNHYEGSRTFSTQLRRSIEETTRLSPRFMLGALGRSGVRVDAQASLAIRFNQFNYQFHTTGDTRNEFHPVPWIGVVEEMNDIATLLQEQRTPAQEEELAESRAFVEKAGGRFLRSALSGPPHIATQEHQEFLGKLLQDTERNVGEGVDKFVDALRDTANQRALADESALRHGWSQLVEQRKRLSQIEGLGRARSLAKEIAAELPTHFRENLSKLAAFAQRMEPRSGAWVWAPFISATLAVQSRSWAHMPTHARGEYSPIRVEHLRPWAMIAELAPTWVVADLVLAEGHALFRHYGALLPQAPVPDQTPNTHTSDAPRDKSLGDTFDLENLF